MLEHVANQLLVIRHVDVVRLGDRSIVLASLPLRAFLRFKSRFFATHLLQPPLLVPFQHQINNAVVLPTLPIVRIILDLNR
jgi:hypothetical protein